MKSRFTFGTLPALRVVMVALTISLITPSALAGNDRREVRLSGGEVSIVPHLAKQLGYFEKEGLDVRMVKGSDIKPHSYLMQQALHKGQIDASVHWFQHTVYGQANGVPVKAVIVLNDSPGVTVMVANRVKSEITDAAGFKGRRVAEGAGYATKSILTNYLAHQAGLPLHSYTPVMIESDGRQEAVIKGLRDGQVDVMTFMEPMTSSLLQTGMVSALYELSSRQQTTKVLGAAWPAQTVFMTPDYINKNPETAQRLVNAFVRTMRFINSHTAQEIAAALPADYFNGKDRSVEVTRIANTLSTYANRDYSFKPAEVDLVITSTQAAPFDASEEGQFRANSRKAVIDREQLYTNQFVRKAMARIKE